MVFARCIAFILSTYLGKFIKGLNKNSVNFSVLRGSFELKNVELASDLLSFSDHFQLESGTIGNLSVSIPWHSLYSRKSEVVIRNVAVIVAPKYCRKGSSSEFFKSKEEFLAAVQAILADEDKVEKTEKESKNGFIHRLTQTILKNLAFRLENISVQLEDKSGCWQGCSAGVKVQIGKLWCEATDANFAPIFIRPEDQAANGVSLYRLVSYENVEVKLIYTAADVREEQTGAPQDHQRVAAVDGFENADKTLCSSKGLVTVAWEGSPKPEGGAPSVDVALEIQDSCMSCNPQCVAALGLLSESVRFAPQRVYAWEKRPTRRPHSDGSGLAGDWWRYAIQKVVEIRRASRQRNRFSWEAFVQRRSFLSSFYHYCTVLLKASWIPEGLEASFDEEQLSRTPAHDIMTCWNAARYYVAQSAKTKEAPQGTLYAQYLNYCCLRARGSVESESQEKGLSLALLDVDVAVRCGRLTTSLDDNLRTVLTNTFLGATKEGQNMSARLSVASTKVVAGSAEDSPLFSIGGGDAGALLSVTKVGSSPVRGQLSVESITTCLDFSLQELLLAKVASYITAAKPFMEQRLSKPTRSSAPPATASDELGATKDPLLSQFDIVVKSVAVSADGVLLCVRNVESVITPQTPTAVAVQEVSAAVNDVSLLQLCSIEVRPELAGASPTVNVVVDSANLSTDVEGFEYAKLLIAAAAGRWKKEANSALTETSSFFMFTEEVERAEAKGDDTPLVIDVHFGFIEYGALALDQFGVHVTLADGWHIRLRAAGGTTEGWCHSVPPHPQDPFIAIDLWADGYLRESPFAGSIEDNGIAFLFTLHHVTLCLGDELAATAESLFDLFMLLIFSGEDRHVHLRDDTLYTIPHISGRLVGSDVRLLLESDGGDLTLLPGYDAAMKDEASRNAFTIPVPPMPLAIELLGSESLDVTLHRYCDKRMDIAVGLKSGVNAALRGTPALIPLLPFREGTRAEIELHLSAPSEADLRVFPYSRVDIAMRLCDAAIVAHIPTIMALWNSFNTPSLPLGRIRNIGNRVHFSSRPSRPGKALAPRSPLSAAVEAIGASALARSSPFSSAAAAQSGDEQQATAPPQPCPVYTTPVFPSDMTLRVEIVRSELYYPWGEGSVAPLFLHAAVPACEVVVLNRDECVEVSVRGMMEMPRVATSFHRFSPAFEEQSERGGADSKRAAAVAGAGNLSKKSKFEHTAAHVENSFADTGSLHSDDSRADAIAAAAAAAEVSPDDRVNASATSPSSPVELAAFPDGEGEFADQQAVGTDCDAPHSSSIQVHVTYTMDSRPPYRPGRSKESLVVSLSGTAVPNSGALPGPLHICLQNPVEVAAWLTFFTYFNVTNTVPLASGDAAVFSTTAACTASNANSKPGSACEGEVKLAAAEAGSGGGGGPADNVRCLNAAIQLTPIVFHLPFAGAAAVLWDGVEFAIAPGYSALRIPRLEVLVHEELLIAEGPTRFGAAGSSLDRAHDLHNSGFCLLSLCGARDSSSRGVVVTPGVLLETHQNGTSAADIRRRFVVPALKAQVNQQTTLVQLHTCETLAAVSRVFAARSAQCALLDAVIQHESRRVGLRYACCGSSSAPGPADPQVQAQLLPFLSPPMVIVLQNACLTFEWESGLQRDAHAGVTVALHNLRCNDYAAHNQAKRRGSAGDPVSADERDTTSLFPLSPSMPFLVDVASVDAYVWWSSTDADVAALMHHGSVPSPNALFTSHLARGGAMDEEEWVEELDKAAKAERRPGSFGTCLPLLLHPISVRTSITSVTSEKDLAGKKEKETQSDKRVDKSAGRRFSSQIESSQSSCTPHAASTASFHTMPSTSDDEVPATTATAPPLVPTPSVSVAPVFEVSPVLVVLSTSAYVVLSEAFVHRGGTAVTAAGGGGAHSTKSTGHRASAAAAHIFRLTRCEVRRPRPGSPSSPSLSAISSPLLRRQSKQASQNSQDSSSGGGSGTSSSAFLDAIDVEGVPAGVDAAAAASPPALDTQVNVLCQYRFDSTQQRVWVERVTRTTDAANTNAGTTATTARAAPAAEQSGTQDGEGVAFIELSAIHAADGLLSSAVAAQLTQPVTQAENDAEVESDGAATDASPAPAPPSAAHVTVVAPFNPSNAVAPRLLSRISVAEVCLRLVLLEDLDTSTTTIGEARAFWQRYTVAHTTSRCAAIAAEGVPSDPPVQSVLAFLTAAVPALRTLLRVPAQSPAASRGSSAANPSRQRAGQPTPAALLEESGVDGLRVQLRRVAVSSFTDARSIAIDACVCTSVKSPSRPLLAAEQVEVYVPTSSVVYPSVGAAARTVARDLKETDGRARAGSAGNADATAAAAAAAATMPTGVSSAGSNGLSRQETGNSPVSPTNTAPAWPGTAATSAHAASRVTGGSAGERPVVMMGEVGCRVEAISVDISATALRAWLSCLVEQPVAALRAAAEEKEKWVAFWGTRTSTDGGVDEAGVDGAAGFVAAASGEGQRREEAAPGSPVAEPLSLLKWRPGRGLRIYEARDAVWSLDHDITLSRNGLVLFFSNYNTNLMTVALNGHTIFLDEALLLQPDGLQQRTVMVIQGGLTVRFVGSGQVQVPLGLWKPSPWDSKGSIGVETVLLPFMAIGEGSYLECVDVRLGFTESVGSSAKEAAAAASPTVSSQRNRPSATPFPRVSPIAPKPTRPAERSSVVTADAAAAAAAAAAAPLTHRSVHLVFPRVSLILEPRLETRQVHISTGVELWMTVCGGVLLRDDLRCTGLAISSESIYDATTTTARTAVLAPVDVRVCSDNGRHHAVSLGPAQVDLGRADLLLLSTYAGEVQAVRSYAKYLTHSRVEKEFLELVEATLAWKAAVPVHALAAEQRDDGDAAGSEDADEGEGENAGAGSGQESGDDGKTKKESAVAPRSPQLPAARTSRHLAGESPRLDAEEHLDVASPGQSPALSRHDSGRRAAAGASSAAPSESEACKPAEEQRAEAQKQPAPQRRRSLRSRQRAQQQQQPSMTRGFSWAVFTPAIELTVSDHRYPLLQVCVNDVVLRRTATSAMASTSLVQCHRASVRVYGRGRWDAVLQPSATLSWSLTQSISRHSSNRHVLVNVEGIHLQCSHLIVAKLLYITRQLKYLATSLQRRLTTAAAAVVGERPAAVVDLSATFRAGVELRNRLDSHALSVTTSKQSSSRASSSASSSSGSSSSSSSTISDDDRGGCHRSTIRHRRQQKQTRHAIRRRDVSGEESSSDSSNSDAVNGSALPLSRRSAHQRVPRLSEPASPTTAVAAAVDPAVTTESAVSSRYTRVDAPAAGAPVPAGMATHRLLNSFRRALFAGICEREVVTTAATAAATTTAASGGAPLYATSGGHGFSERGGWVDGSLPVVNGPTVWRCRELYRLPPASATDIFISYRRARSLVLTFFPVGCVEWDEDSGMWVLNAVGETDLAAKAVAAMRSPNVAAAASAQVESDGADAASNWFPFTTLQYGMARPVDVRTTTRISVGRPSATTGISSPVSSDITTASKAGERGTAFVDRPRSLGNAGSSEFSNYKIQTYALALTCVDPDEEAESLRCPLVVAPGEWQGGGGISSSHGGSTTGSVAFYRDSHRTRLAGAAASGHTSPMMSRGASLVHVDSAGGDAALLGDGLRTVSGRSADLVAADRPHELTAAHSHTRQRSPTSSPTSASPPMQQSASHRHGGRDGSAHHGIAARLPRHGNHTAAVDDGGDGDLLVVRLQARSSLLNETGCTLQLSSPPTTSHGATAAAPATSFVTVPPGWRLPLEEEDEQDEVTLRVCCPSARWVSSADDGGGDAAAAAPATAGEDKKGLGAVAAARWYETRLVLGDLDSGRFLSLSRATRRPSRATEAAVPTAAVAADAGVFEDEDRRPLTLFVVITYSSDNLVRHISLYPRLTLVNHLGVKVRIAVFQQDPAAGPQTPDEAALLAPWTAPYVGRRRHERERFHRSLVALGAHDALPHQHALPLHFCTYSSNLVLGLSFSQSTGDSLITADLDPVVAYLREAVDRHPRMLLLHDSHGRTFYVQVSVMPRTVVLSVALWVYNLTEYPLLLCDSVVTRRLCPGQSSTTGIIPSQGEPFLIGCRLADFTHGFVAIGLDGGWSGAVPIDVGSTGVFVSAQSRLGIERSCNYAILFPNAQEGRPMVLQVTPRWVFYNNTQKRLRMHFRFPGLAKAMQEAEKRRRQLRLQEAESAAAAAATTATDKSAQHNQILRQADDNVATLASLAAVQLNPGDYHVSCVGPIEGNRFCVQDVLEGVLPSITSIAAIRKDSSRAEHRDVAAFYESHLTPYMDVDRPGEATFNLWAAPRAPGKQMAVCYGGDLIVQRPVFPHPTWLEPYDAYATDAVITGRIAVEVQNTENVLTVLLQPIQGTKILLQNRTAGHTVMVRQQGSRRRNRIPPRQNRFFLWEDARQEHRIRVHILGFKARWFDVDFSAGECKAVYYEDRKAAAAAEALAAAQQTHPCPTHVLCGEAPHTPFPFCVRGYANLEKTRVTIIVTESAIPPYASIDAWRTSAVLSLRMSMVHLGWVQEVGAGAAAAVSGGAFPFGAAAAATEAEGGGAAAITDGKGEAGVVATDGGAGHDEAAAAAATTAQTSSEARRRRRSVFALSRTFSSASLRRSGGETGSKLLGASAGSFAAAAATPLLFSLILEGVQLERLSTEDTETFFFVIHQMQWIDEKQSCVIVYRARPRLPAEASAARQRWVGLRQAPQACHGAILLAVLGTPPHLPQPPRPARERGRRGCCLTLPTPRPPRPTASWTLSLAKAMPFCSPWKRRMTWS